MANCKAEWHSKGNREEADPGEVCGDPDTDTDTYTVTDSKTNTTITFKRKSSTYIWMKLMVLTQERHANKSAAALDGKYRLLKS